MSKNKRIIFYHPKPISSSSDRGSGVRPFNLLNAFKELGYEVNEVAGYSSERRNSIKEVQRVISAGGGYLFAYAESSNAPIALNNPNRIPLHPAFDYNFFRFLNEQRIPLGLFYRDIFWKFSCFKQMLPWYQRVLSLPFYKMDWRMYRKYVQHLFLPSLSMNYALPDMWPNPHRSALPAGVDDKISINLEKTIPSDDLIQCLYVGGIKPPVHDLYDTLKEISKIPTVRLILCCPESEWNELQSYYRPIMNDNIKVCHKRGNDLIELYHDAHISLLVLAPYETLNFSMPVKLMESISHGVPIISNSGTEYARFISKNKVGWLVNKPAEIAEVFSKLRKDPYEYRRKIHKISSVKETNKWTDRAENIADTLTRYVMHD